MKKVLIVFLFYSFVLKRVIESFCILSTIFDGGIQHGAKEENLLVLYRAYILLREMKKLYSIKYKKVIRKV